MTNTSRNPFARRLAAVAALAVVPALALGISPVANAGTTSFSGCDNPTSKPTKIWDGVSPATHSPTSMGSNLDIQWPNGDAGRGWAVHQGHEPAVATDLLVVPTILESGIECENLLHSDAPKYFKHAYDERGLMKGKDWVVGINSKDSRGEDQLHIHLTQLYNKARHDIQDALANGKITNDENQWLNSVIEVTTHNDKGVDSMRGYRAWHTANIDQNFFAVLNERVVKPLQKQGKHVTMGDEAMVITSDGKGGFVVLASDRASLTKPYGVNNMEGLFWKGD